MSTVHYYADYLTIDHTIVRLYELPQWWYRQSKIVCSKALQVRPGHGCQKQRRSDIHGGAIVLATVGLVDAAAPNIENP